MLPADCDVRVKNFAALGYSPERIAVLLALTSRQRDELLLRLDDPNDELSIAYRRGAAIGDYNVDVALMKQAETGDNDSIKLREERNNTRCARDLRHKLFGV